MRPSIIYQLASIADEAIGSSSLIFKQRFGVDLYELRVLRLIDDEPGVTFTELCKVTRVERSATSRILSQLVQAGLAKRCIHEDDARQFRFFATSKGRSLRQKADPLTHELEAFVLSTLNENEKEQFLSALAKIANWVRGDQVGAEMEARYPEVKNAKMVPSARSSKSRGVIAK